MSEQAWWINTNPALGWKVKAVSTHAPAVLASPKDFGLDHEDMKDLGVRRVADPRDHSPHSDTTKLINAATSLGHVRARKLGDHLFMEVSGNANHSVPTAIQHLRAHGVDVDRCRVSIDDPTNRQSRHFNSAAEAEAAGKRGGLPQSKPKMPIGMLLRRKAAGRSVGSPPVTAKPLQAIPNDARDRSDIRARMRRETGLDIPESVRRKR